MSAASKWIVSSRLFRPKPKSFSVLKANFLKTCSYHFVTDLPLMRKQGDDMIQALKHYLPISTRFWTKASFWEPEGWTCNLLTNSWYMWTKSSQINVQIYVQSTHLQWHLGWCCGRRRSQNSSLSKSSLKINMRRRMYAMYCNTCTWKIDWIAIYKGIFHRSNYCMIRWRWTCRRKLTWPSLGS